MKSFFNKRLEQANSTMASNIAKMLTCVALACTISITPCYAQQIITDGNTATSLNTVDTVTDVTTTTTRGTNAFNSFTKFNVDAGNTVNLVVPNTSDNLINLVTGQQTQINGILNSVKNGVLVATYF